MFQIDYIVLLRKTVTWYSKGCVLARASLPLTSFDNLPFPLLIHLYQHNCFDLFIALGDHTPHSMLPFAIYSTGTQFINGNDISIYSCDGNACERFERAIFSFSHIAVCAKLFDFLFKKLHFGVCEHSSIISDEDWLRKKSLCSLPPESQQMHKQKDLQRVPSTKV